MTIHTASFLVRIVLTIGAIGTTSAYVAKRINRHGVVTAVLYVDIDEIKGQMEGSSIVVDGEILREGQSIYGAEVVGIEKFCAEFEKDGVRWKQEVRQKPNSAWGDTK